MGRLDKAQLRCDSEKNAKYHLYEILAENGKRSHRMNVWVGVSMCVSEQKRKCKNNWNTIYTNKNNDIESEREEERARVKEWEAGVENRVLKSNIIYEEYAYRHIYV